MTKPETLLELVERLDFIYRKTRDSGKWREHEPKSDFVKAWPRLRDTIREMRDFIDADADLEQYRWEADGSNPARDMLARLDGTTIATSPADAPSVDQGESISRG